MRFRSYAAGAMRSAARRRALRARGFEEISFNDGLSAPFVTGRSVAL